MNSAFDHQTIKQQAYGEVTLRDQRFQDCLFVQCDFTGTDLSSANFEACRFERCNFSLTKWHQTSLQGCIFIHSKLIGVDFSRCRTFGLSFSFEDCLVELCSFNQLHLNEFQNERTQFRHCTFSGSQFPQAIFSHCDFEGTTFHHTDLHQADFRSASNYRLDPTSNTIKQAQFTYPGLLGLLQDFDVRIS